MEVHVRGQEKKQYLTNLPPEWRIDEWERGCTNFFSDPE